MIYETNKTMALQIHEFNLKLQDQRAERERKLLAKHACDNRVA